MRLSLLLALVLLAAPAGAEPWTLEKLIAAARVNDGRVKSAGADLKVLQGKYDEARWAWFPKVDSTFYLAGPTPEAKNNGVGGPPTTQPTYMYDLNFGQPGVMMGAHAEGVLPIYTWGKLEALEVLAAKGVQVGAALQTRAADEAEQQTTQAYWGLQLARGGRKSLVEALQKLDQATATLKRLREQQSEQVTQMDVYKLDFLRREVEARSGAADSGERLALQALKVLVGAQGELEVVQEDLPEAGGQPQPVEVYKAMALRNRPEVRAVDAGLAAREREVFIRERMYLPDIGIAGFFNWKWTTSATRQKSPFAYDPYNDLSAGLALAVHQTWDFPSKAAQLDQSRAELEKLEYQRDLLVAAVGLEVEKAHGELSEALSRAGKHTQAERAARRWATSAFAAFDVGTTDTRDVFESFGAWAVASGEKIQAWHDVQVALSSLSKAAGAHIELVH